ncbi:hypothetical protein Tco_1064180, partial [Tanacetum coccineum]
GIPQWPQSRTESECGNSKTENGVQRGHQCKTCTLKVLEVEEEPDEQPTNEVNYIAGNANDVAEISLHVILGKPHLETIKVQGVQVEKEKVSVGESCPIPFNFKEVKGFLGLTGYYRGFVQNYGLIARPLTSLTKKDRFDWSDEAFIVFTTLKQALGRSGKPSLY